MSDQKLSLWAIEAEIEALIDQREELAAAGDPDRHAQIAAVDLKIQEWIGREVRKVDGIRGYLKHCDMMAGAAKAEAQAQSQRSKAWEDRGRRIKACVASVMDAAGLKKLEGQTGTLMLKGNGGVQPVTITDAEMVPDDLCSMTVTMTVVAWNWALDVLSDNEEAVVEAEVKGLTAAVGPRTPMLEKIREALEANCAACGGTGHEKQQSGEPYCAACGGTGKQGVPGAYLEERGKHVEIK